MTDRREGAALVDIDPGGHFTEDGWWALRANVLVHPEDWLEPVQLSFVRYDRRIQELVSQVEMQLRLLAGDDAVIRRTYRFKGSYERWRKLTEGGWLRLQDPELTDTNYLD